MTNRTLGLRRTVFSVGTVKTVDVTTVPRTPSASPFPSSPPRVSTPRGGIPGTHASFNAIGPNLNRVPGDLNIATGLKTLPNTSFGAINLVVNGGYGYYDALITTCAKAAANGSPTKPRTPGATRGTS